jgi:hypothetical protein
MKSPIEQISKYFNKIFCDHKHSYQMDKDCGFITPRRSKYTQMTI